MRFEWFQIFEWASLIAAVYCRRGLAYFSIGIFIPLLLVVNVFETIGVNHRLFHRHDSYNIYSFYNLAVTPLYLYAFQQMMMAGKTERYLIRFVGVICMLLLLINLFYIQGLYLFNTWSITLTQVMNIVF
jgi:hypothetical protein